MGVERVGLVDVNSEVVPLLLFGSGFAGVPFVPVNYRLADDQLRTILADGAIGGHHRGGRAGAGRIDRRRGVPVPSAVPRLDARTGSGRPGVLARPGRRRHPAVHQRDDGRAQGRGAPPQARDVVRHHDRRVHGRWRRRRRPRERPALPRGEPRPWSRVRSRGGGSSTSRPSRPRTGWRPPATRRSPRRWSSGPCSVGSSTCSRRRARRCRPSATSPMAVVACRRRSSSGHSACSPTWSS